tara:strand:- start:20 stop:358 length:339 start_codon:yes stop_codon:yes gene_type:complete
VSTTELCIGSSLGGPLYIVHKENFCIEHLAKTRENGGNGPVVPDKLGQFHKIEFEGNEGVFVRCRRCGKTFSVEKDGNGDLSIDSFKEVSPKIFTQSLVVEDLDLDSFGPPQ